MVNRISIYDQYLFHITPRTRNLEKRLILKAKAFNQLDIFVDNVIYFWNKLPNQTKNYKSVKKIRLNWKIPEK